MNKQTKIYAVLCAVALVIFSIVTFTIPGMVLGVNTLSTLFVVSFVLVAVELLAQAAIVFVTEKSNKKFINLSLVSVGYIALALTFVAGTVCVMVEKITWIGAVVGGLATVFMLVAVLLGKAPEAEKRNFIREATVEAEIIMSRATTPALQAEAKKVYEALRYSDPISVDALSEIESKIDASLKEFRVAVDEADEQVAAKIANELTVAVKERSIRCKAYKPKV